MGEIPGHFTDQNDASNGGPDDCRKQAGHTKNDKILQMIFNATET